MMGLSEAGGAGGRFAVMIFVFLQEQRAGLPVSTQIAFFGSPFPWSSATHHIARLPGTALLFTECLSRKISWSLSQSKGNKGTRYRAKSTNLTILRNGADDLPEGWFLKFATSIWCPL
jgi:hypothetical protein